MTTLLAYFPSPPRGVWHLGPLPIRAYALFIIVGIVASLVIGDRRWAARGGQRGVIYDIALWAVPFGLVGGRLYHLATDWRTYWGPGGAGFGAALRIWDGGLGIWGAVALGGVGAWIGCRRRGIPLPAFADALAPGLILAQAIGRLGNYFNQELYGRETTLPWGLEIFYRRDPSGYVDPHSLDGASTGQVALVVEPTFLYELIWNLLVFVVLIYVDRRFKLGHGRLFALYVAGYCVGRFCIELLRNDTATLIAGIRINVFTSTFVFIGAVVYMILAPKGREDPQSLGADYVAEKAPEPEPATVAAATAVTAGAAAADGGDDDEEAETAEAEAAKAAAAEPDEEAEEPEAEKPEGEADEPEAEAAEAEAEEPEAQAEEAEAEQPEAEAEEAETEEAEAEEAEGAEAEAEVEEPKAGADDAEAEEPEAEAEEAEGAEPEAEVEEPEAEAEEAEGAEADVEEAVEGAEQGAEEPEAEAEEAEGAEADVAEAEDEEPEVTDAETAVAEAVETEPAEPEAVAAEAEEAEGEEPKAEELEAEELEAEEPKAEPQAEEPEADSESPEPEDAAEEPAEETSADVATTSGTAGPTRRRFSFRLRNRKTR